MIIAMQLKNLAATQYDLDFNSVTVFNGKFIFAGAGIFSLGGDTDNGARINAYAELSPHFTGGAFRPRSIDLGGDENVDLVVSMDGRAEEYPMSNSEGQKRRKVVCRRVKPGSYMTVKIKNRLGGDFSVDSLDAVLTNNGKRV